MLATNPARRAQLSEVLTHPWMIRGYLSPPDLYLMHREPLRGDALDPTVMCGMVGFEFGTSDDIERRLKEVLESDVYVRAMQTWNQNRVGAIPHSRDSDNWSPNLAKQKEAKPKKRFLGFDFEIRGRRLFSINTSSATVIPGSPSFGTSLSSRSRLSDPRGPHPLISIYYLVLEKQERERGYGLGYSHESYQLALRMAQDRPFDRLSNLCLDGQIQEKSMYVVASGGYADIWTGSLGGRKVAIKVMRAFSSTGTAIERKKITKVCSIPYLSRWLVNVCFSVSGGNMLHGQDSPIQTYWNV